MQSSDFRQKEILSILKESVHEFGKLKAQLSHLCVFFATMKNNMENAMHEVDAFLEILSRNIRRNDEDVETLRLRGASKRVSYNASRVGWKFINMLGQQRVLFSAMLIQGQFSVTADVSAAYVKASDQYIHKAIDKMEDLATTENSKWPGARQEFTKWCNDAVKGINGVAKEASANMAPNMQKRIGLLQTLAIEAAEENED